MKDYDQILKQLTLEEKLKLTHGNSRWGFFGVERLGLPELYCADGPHGLRAYKTLLAGSLFDDNDLVPTTMFPVSAAMAATFEPDLIHQVGHAIGEECNSHGVDLILAPGVNLKRSPLGGRNFEYYSEDPYLSGVCATAFINGVQETGVGACIKHFALNEQETMRRFIDTDVDDLTLHDHYLRPFYHAIKHANPLAIMTSYNRVRGHYAGESSFLMQHILRDTWNYDGMVISDWGGVQHKVKSVKNGMNIEMPGPSEFHVELQEAIKTGELTEKEVDQSLIPLIRFYERVKDNPNKGKPSDMKRHHNVAYNLAKEAIVLLENDGTLPLKPNIRLAVIGDYAEHPRINGGGSVTVLPNNPENPLEELRKEFDVSYASGYDKDGVTDLDNVRLACDNAEVILFFTGSSQDTEGHDSKDIDIPTSHLKVFDILRTSDKPIVIVLNNGSAIDVTPLLDRANAMVESWLLGEANAVALIDILTGRVNPSGRLSETFPIQLSHTPHYGAFPSTQDIVHYHGDLLKNGYRHYDLHNLPVRYPFGYGLSYSTFSYDELKIDKEHMLDSDNLELTVTITNTGRVPGKETIQVYLEDLTSIHPRPKQELKAFRKVHLDSGETKHIKLVLSSDAFAMYSPHHETYRVETGRFVIHVGPNVNELPLQAIVDVAGENFARTSLTLDYPAKAFKQHKPDIFEQLEAAIGRLPWYNMEEPTERVLRRLKRRHNWDEDTYQKWVTTFLS